MYLRSQLIVPLLFSIALSTIGCGDDDPCDPEACEGTCQMDVCVAASCDDGAQNGGESDIDCGGECGGCELAQSCLMPSDCESGLCMDDQCAMPVSCMDAVLNGDETDLDCGGMCPDCGNGQMCGEDADCASDFCADGLCAERPITCTDGAQNGNETDVDCGGDCDDCAVGQMCSAPTDCTTRQCAGGRCAEMVASCLDAIQNGDETDVDCGGSCDACEIGEMCVETTDCETLTCTDARCATAPPSCSDEEMNGAETDVDCGGGCNACLLGRMCAVDGDCDSALCSDNTCIRQPTCTDGSRNGNETGIDCGGSCAGCDDGQVCEGPDDCRGGFCTDSVCGEPPATCSDGRRNGSETSIDCGGGACGPCASGLTCVVASDCDSVVCTGSVCQTPSCSDGARNGDETDADCGGSCSDCVDGRTCGGPDDCVSNVCTADICAAAACGDGVQNGDETDTDCGGSCAACVDGEMCIATTDCESRVCTGSLCVAPSCSDGVRNANETDVDCGGDTCTACGRGRLCVGPSDCSTAGCAGGMCVIGPTAAFSLDVRSGGAPLTVTATSTASAGDASISTTEYNFGSGFGASTNHTYVTVGSYTVTQRVTDGNGFVDTTTLSVTATDPSCGWSATDQRGSGMDIQPDNLSIEWNIIVQATVRSECNVTPMSGVFYYELSLKSVDCDPTQAPEGCYDTPFGHIVLGVTDDVAPLTEYPGQNTHGLGVGSGSIFYNNNYQDGIGDPSVVGFVVDYRLATPTVHMVGTNFGTAQIVHTQILTAVTGPIHAMVQGERRKIGIELMANFGGNITLRPFHYDPVAILNGAGFAAEAAALTLGFPVSGTSAPNTPPSLSVTADFTTTVGTPINVTGSATDAEDGTLTSSIVWENLAGTYNTPARSLGTGASAGFTPTEIGRYPVRATVIDSRGVRTQAVVLVTVTNAMGTMQVEQVATMSLNTSDPLVGTAIDANGLRARWTHFDKNGIRANQGMMGHFRYFEGHRIHPMPINQGVGLVVSSGDLNPYRREVVPPSVSMNTTGSTWQNIIYIQSFDSAESEYGYAVDYRGLNPTVYYLVRDGGTLIVINSFTMYDTFVPLYPMLYGNLTDTMSGSYDIELLLDPTNHLLAPADVTAALSSFGVGAGDLADLEFCWRDTECP